MPSKVLTVKSVRNLLSPYFFTLINIFLINFTSVVSTLTKCLPYSLTRDPLSLQEISVGVTRDTSVIEKYIEKSIHQCTYTENIIVHRLCTRIITSIFA